MARPATAFSGQGVTFDQVLLEGRLGGLAGLRTYVSSRRIQLQRKLARLSAGSEDYRRCEAAHEAFVEVEALLPRIADRALAQKIGVGASYLKGPRT